MHAGARKSTPGVGGFSRPESKTFANNESGGQSSIIFPVSSFWHYREQAGDERNNIRYVSDNFAFERIWAAEPSHSVLEELRSRGNESGTDVSFAASQTLILKLIHAKVIVSRFELYLTVLWSMTQRVLQLIVISGRMRIVEWLR
jgi:hypothetical protein